MWGALIGAGISIAASAIGSHFANKKKAEAEEAYQKGINQEIRRINKELDSNYLDSAEAQNALRKLTNSNKETLRQLNTDAIRGGASEEAKVAMASKLTQGTADVVGDLAVVGERKKEGLRQEKRNIRLGMLQHQYANDADTSGIYNVVGAIGDAANSLGAGIDSKKAGTAATNATSAGTGATVAPDAAATAAPPPVDGEKVLIGAPEVGIAPGNEGKAVGRPGVPITKNANDRIVRYGSRRN